MKALFPRICAVLMLFALPVSAAPDAAVEPFVSIEVLKVHIDEHLAELIRLAAQNPRDEQRILSECAELDEHARQIIRLAENMADRTESLQMAGVLRQLGRMLQTASRRNNLDGAIRILTELQRQLAL